MERRKAVLFWTAFLYGFKVLLIEKQTLIGY